MKILIVDDHTIVREGVKMLLTITYPFAEITEACDATELMKLVMEKEWDIIITDINMPPGDSTIENIKKIKEHAPATHVIVLSMHPAKDYAVRAIKAGASCYLVKNYAANELITAVNRAISGKKYLSGEVAGIMADAIASNSNRAIENLSKREREVFNQLALSKSVSDIAREMELSKNTISTFRSRVFEKMDFQSDTELIRYAIDHKLV